MRFRTKLFLASALGVFLLSAGTILPILSLIWSNFNRMANSNFAGMRQGLVSMQTEHNLRMRQIGKIFMQIPELRALIAEENSEVSADNLASLQDRLNDLTQVMNVGFLCVFDGRGSVIAQDSKSPWTNLDDLRSYLSQSAPAQALLRDLYNEQPNGDDQGEFGIWLYHGSLYQVVGLPLLFESDQGPAKPEGALVMAAPLDSEMARHLVAMHNCDISFLTADGGIISSLPPELSRQLRQTYDKSDWKSSDTIDIALNGTTYRSYIEPLIDPCSGTQVGQTVVQTSLVEGIALQWDITRRILVLMAGGLLVAALVSFLLSDAVTRPVRQLLLAVQRVADGDLTSTIKVSRNDEIGELAAGFNDMLAQLQARQELEKRVVVSQAANKAKSQFLANMSHEIRTPLHGVIGMANLLLATDMNDRQRHYAQLVKSSTEVLTTLINDILDFSKIEAGRLELESVEFQLHPAIEDVVELLYEKANSKGVAMACDIADDVPTQVCGDPTRFRQILLNLVGNAVKFTHTGQVIVRVSRPPEPADRALLRFEVIDTGIGIPPDGVERLFKSFSQVDASTTRRFGGTGLGLAICRQLTELMGGQIGVESEVGAGSKFWFTVKFKSAVMVDGPGLNLIGRRALVAEENDSVRHILCRQLTSAGMEAVGVKDSAEASAQISKAAAESHPLSVALLSGRVQGFVEILKSATAANIPQIYLGTGGNSEAPGSFHEAGFRAAVFKPVRRQHLLAAVAEALGLSPRKESRRKSNVAASTEGSHAVRILVAEDNEVNRIVVAEFLRKSGFESDIVIDGQGAVEAMEQKHYDLVLMDCQMPGMDGFQATIEIRRREQIMRATGTTIAETPIIALTAGASGADKAKCIEVGMNAYCGKPFREDQLLNTIASLLPKEKIDLQAISKATIAPVGDENNPLNLPALMERCSNDTGLALTVLTKFESQISGLIGEIHKHLHKEDAIQVTRLVHTLKGTAGMVGAEPLRQALAEVEKIGRSNELARGQAQIDRLRAETERCIATMAQVRVQLVTAAAATET